MSARARIVGWMLALVALALGGSIFTAWTALLARVDVRVNEEFRNEADKLARAAEDRPARDLGTFLTRYLEVNAPDRWETFFTLVDGEPYRRTGVEPAAVLDTDDDLVRRIAATAEPVLGETGTAAGTVKYAAIPVRVAGDPRRGHVVVAIFYDRHRQEVVDAVRATTTMTTCRAAASTPGRAAPGPRRPSRRRTRYGCASPRSASAPGSSGSNSTAPAA